SNILFWSNHLRSPS
ncbi:rCG41147, partial [Rattus norvegicus]